MSTGLLRDRVKIETKAIHDCVEQSRVMVTIQLI